jgi:hypothetical protein
VKEQKLELTFLPASSRSNSITPGRKKPLGCFTMAGNKGKRPVYSSAYSPPPRDRPFAVEEKIKLLEDFRTALGKSISLIKRRVFRDLNLQYEDDQDIDIPFDSLSDDQLRKVEKFVKYASDPEVINNVTDAEGHTSDAYIDIHIRSEFDNQKDEKKI